MREWYEDEELSGCCHECSSCEGDINYGEEYYIYEDEIYCPACFEDIMDQIKLNCSRIAGEE